MILTLAFAGARLLSGSEGDALKVWDLASGRCLRTITSHYEAVRCCAIYAQGTRFVSGGDDRLLNVFSSSFET